MKAYLYLDVETTGINPSINDVIQVACIPFINGKEYESFNEFCQPKNWNSIDDMAVKVHGISIEQMKTFQSSEDLVEKLVQYIRKFNIKFIMAGYNTNFDKSFIGSLFAKVGRSNDFSSIFSTEIRDVYARARHIKDKLNTKKYKLVNLAEEFNIEIDAHDALSDIRATLLVDKKIAELAGEDFVEVFIKDKVEELNIPELPQLHLHSEFSNTDSVISVEEWINWAVSKNIPAISFPDHNWAASLYKSINKKEVIKNIAKTFNNKINEESITIVPSISLNVKSNELGISRFRLNAWAISNIGYFNLIKLSSMGWGDAIDDSNVKIAIIDINDVAKYSDGVVFGSACEKGIIGEMLLESFDSHKILENLNIVKQKLNNFILELLPIDILRYYDKGLGFRSYSPSGSLSKNISESINKIISKAVDSFNFDYIISTIAHFIEEDDKVLQDVVSKSSFKDKRFFYESRHYRNINEQYAILKRHLPEWVTLDIIKKARYVAEDICNKSKTINIEHEYHLPEITIPEDIKARSSDYNKQLYFLMMKKIKQHNRWSDDPIYVERFKKELDVILKNEHLNFIPYFLLYEDICSYARSCGILQNIARGSAGGCLISYYLKIIHVDPIKEKLPFERFLSHARIRAGSFPDIDLDLGNRTPVLKYLYDKYKLGFAQIGTFQKFKTKNAIKDAMFAIFGRNRNDKEVAMVCSTIADSPQGLDEHDFLYGYTDSEGIYHRGILEQNEVLQKFFNQYPEIEQITKKLIGLPKGMGRHASAFVISTLDISHTRTPTMIFIDEDLGPVPVTQFEAPMVEKSGLVKADILGLTTIKTIESAVSLIKENHGVDLLEEDNAGVQMLYRLPEDNAVYEDFYRRRTDSSFQFNTDLIKGYIKDFAPISRKDLSNLTALCRPGALDVEVLPGVSATKFYIDVRNGNRNPEYIHEDLKEILEETNGVVAFQEQLMEILVKFCGYTLEESDQIRSAIAKKKHEVMTKAFERVRSETAKLGWAQEQASKLCDVLTAYSNYSFNKSHSRAYAELGYITMYLKRNFFLEWWVAELNNSGEDKIRHYISILGDKIIPPSIKNPSDTFAISGDKIAAPLSTIKGLGPASIKSIIKNGPYASIEDFVTKTKGKVNASHFWAILKAGVFDEFAESDMAVSEIRRSFLDYYSSVRKMKSVPADVTNLSPIDMFLSQRDVYKCFNKTILSDALIRKQIAQIWPSMRETNRKEIPFAFGFSPSIPVIASVNVAQKILKNQEFEDNKEVIKVAMIGFYQSSEHKNGVSKKGKPWSLVRVNISDGLMNMECVKWDHKKSFRFSKNCLVYVMGILKTGWKGAPSLEILDIEKIENIKTTKK